MKKTEKAVAEAVSTSVAVVNAPGQSTDPRPDYSLVQAQIVVDGIASEVREACESSVESFIRIGSCLKKARDDAVQSAALVSVGYSDVYDFALKVFGFRSTSVKNFISVFDSFAEKGGSYPRLSAKYDGYSFTQLVELLPVSDDLSSYKPDMTVSEIRDKKVLARIKDAKEGLSNYVHQKWAEALRPFLVSLSIGSGHEGAPYGWDGFVVLFFSGLSSLSDKMLSGFIGFDPAKDRFVSSGVKIGKADAPWEFTSRLEGDSPDKLKSGAKSAFKALADRMREDGDAKAESRKAREAAKREKPEWQLWHEMPDADKRLSFGPKGFRDPKLHPFFVTFWLYPDGGVVDASNHPCPFVRVLCTFAFGDGGKKVTDKAIDVIYLWRGGDGAIASCHGSGDVSALVSLLDSWCAAQLAAGKGASK